MVALTNYSQKLGKSTTNDIQFLFCTTTWAPKQLTFCRTVIWLFLVTANLQKKLHINRRYMQEYTYLKIIAKVSAEKKLWKKWITNSECCSQDCVELFAYKVHMTQQLEKYYNPLRYVFSVWVLQKPKHI